MIDKFEIGQEVFTTRNIDEPASGDSPGGRYASKGVKLIIRDINPEHHFPYKVSHPEITDSTFSVLESEISNEE